ncbi:MAG: alanine racemase [Gemmatimonadaceae bacterium]
MLTRARLEVDLAALRRNAETLRERAGVPLIPMIKADAYGLGAVQVAGELESLEPSAYGVATVNEGEELRSAGIIRPIIIFTPVLEEDFASVEAAGLTPTLGTAEGIRAWARTARPYELSIDTGMARAGVPWREVGALVETLERYPPDGAYTHFHSANLSDGSMDEQEDRFQGAIRMLRTRPRVLHTDASAAIARHGRSRWDAVRPGIFMYGVGSGDGALVEPESVVSVKAPIVETRWIEPGDTVSYEAAWMATERRRIATIAAGYADGYPRGAGDGAHGVVRSRRAPIAGRITMDMIMLDVTDTEAEPGDVVTMIGDAGEPGGPLDVAAVADLAGMSPYEVLTGLRGRLQRTYRR